MSATPSQLAGAQLIDASSSGMLLMEPYYRALTPAPKSARCYGLSMRRSCSHRTVTRRTSFACGSTQGVSRRGGEVEAGVHTGKAYMMILLLLLCLPSMVKLKELTGHTSRVLHMAQSPDGATVVSAAPDETIRFWNIFGSGAVSIISPSCKSSDENNNNYYSRPVPRSSLKCSCE